MQLNKNLSIGLARERNMPEHCLRETFAGRAMSEARKVITTLSAGCASLVIILVMLLLVVGGYFGGLPHIGATTAFVAWTIGVIPLVLLMFLVIGGPALNYLRPRGWSARRYITWGAFLMSAFVSGSWFALFSPSTMPIVIMVPLVGILAGAAGAAIMWYGYEPKQ